MLSVDDADSSFLKKRRGVMDALVRFFFSLEGLSGILKEEYSVMRTGEILHRKNCKRCSVFCVK